MTQMPDKNAHPAGTPRWVKVFAIVAVAAIVLVVVLLVVGKGGHGPSRHTEPPAGVIHAQQ
jgi:negative regulator of sigma E activity